MVRLPPDLVQRVDAFAKRDRLSRSAALRVLVRQALEASEGTS